VKLIEAVIKLPQWLALSLIGIGALVAGQWMVHGYL